MLGREAGETEAGGAEHSHSDAQSQGKAVVMDIDVDVSCGAAQHSGYSFHLQGCFCPTL